MKQSNKKAINITGIFTVCGGGVQGAKIFVNDQSRSLGAPLAKCLEILCAAMPYSAAWMTRIDTLCQAGTGSYARLENTLVFSLYSLCIAVSRLQLEARKLSVSKCGNLRCKNRASSL